jgi:hypothetical protein
MLTMAIQAILVGLDDEARNLLTKAESWLEAAIADDETPISGRDAETCRTENYSSLAITKWLLHDRIDRSLFATAEDQRRSYYQNCPWFYWGFGHVVVQFLPHGSYAEAKALLEGCPEFKRPKRDEEIRCPEQMAWLVCQHELENKRDMASLRIAFERFFRIHVPVCMGLVEAVGRWTDLAAWMLVARRYFAEDAAPFDAVRRAFNFVEIGRFE